MSFGEEAEEDEEETVKVSTVSFQKYIFSFWRANEKFNMLFNQEIKEEKCKQEQSRSSGRRETEHDSRSRYCAAERKSGSTKESQEIRRC